MSSLVVFLVLWWFFSSVVGAKWGFFKKVGFAIFVGAILGTFFGRR